MTATSISEGQAFQLVCEMTEDVMSTLFWDIAKCPSLQTGCGSAKEEKLIIPSVENENHHVYHKCTGGQMSKVEMSWRWSAGGKRWRRSTKSSLCRCSTCTFWSTSKLGSWSNARIHLIQFQELNLEVDPNHLRASSIIKSKSYCS